MAIQLINLGTAPKGVDGDTQRTANRKMNENMQFIDASMLNRKTGGVVENYFEIRHPSVWVGVLCDNTHSAPAGVFYDIARKGVPTSSQQFVFNANGSSGYILRLSPAGDSALARHEEVLRVSHEGVWHRAYGLLHDHFVRRTGDAISGTLSMRGTSWASGTVHESHSAAFAPDAGGETSIFHRRNVGNYDEAVIRAKVEGSNWRDFTFRANGNAYASGSWLTASDTRLKDDIVPLAGMRGLLDSIQPIHYTMNAQKSIGYSAQELQNVLPDCVHVAGDTRDKDGNEVKDALAVNYSAMAAVNTQLIKEQEAVIRALLKRVEALEKRLTK